MRLVAIARGILLPAWAAAVASCGGESPTSTPKPPVEQAPPVAPAAASIALAPDSLALGTWGDTARFAATVRDQNGNVMSVAPTWVSSDTLVARVDDSGRVTSMRAGRAVISATAGSVRAERPVRVVLQPNAQCRPVAGAPVRPAIAGAPSFVRAPRDAFQVTSPRYNMTMTAAADFDRDGDQDLMVFSSSFPPAARGGEVLFWRNTGGGFRDATAEAFGGARPVADHTREIEIADLNGDGVLDVFAAQHGYDTDPWDGAPDLLLLSQPGGGMREVGAANLHPYERNGYTHASASGDVDCDGDVDLFAGSGGGGAEYRQTHHLYINTGAGSFVSENARMPADVKAPEFRFTSAVTCDFDRDGDPDLYLGGNENNPDVFLVNDGYGRFRHAPRGRTPALRYGTSGHTVDLQCVDINLDGWPDLVITTANDEYEVGSTARGGFNLWLNRGDLRFEDATAALAPNEVVQDWIWRAFPGDFNGDGWPDLFAKSDRGRDRIYINQGEARFLAMDAPREYLDWVDADGDGRTDLFWSGGTGPGGEQYAPDLYLAR